MGTFLLGGSPTTVVPGACRGARPERAGELCAASSTALPHPPGQDGLRGAGEGRTSGAAGMRGQGQSRAGLCRRCGADCARAVGLAVPAPWGRCCCMAEEARVQDPAARPAALAIVWSSSASCPQPHGMGRGFPGGSALPAASCMAVRQHLGQDRLCRAAPGSGCNAHMHCGGPRPWSRHQLPVAMGCLVPAFLLPALPAQAAAAFWAQRCGRGSH